MPIRSFKDTGTRDIARGDNTKEARKLLPVNFHRTAQIKLAILHRAKTLMDLAMPGLRLEQLRGNREGQRSIRLNSQYRICFYWNNGEIERVEIVDYH